MIKALKEWWCTVAGHNKGLEIWDTERGHLVHRCTRCGRMKTIAVVTHRDHLTRIEHVP